MCFTFKKNNKQKKKPVNCFLQDDASAGIQSLQTSIEIKLPKLMERTIRNKTFRVTIQFCRKGEKIKILSVWFPKIVHILV